MAHYVKMLRHGSGSEIHKVHPRFELITVTSIGFKVTNPLILGPIQFLTMPHWDLALVKYITYPKTKLLAPKKLLTEAYSATHFKVDLCLP